MSIVDQIQILLRTNTAPSEYFADAVALQKSLVDQGIVKKTTYDIPMVDVVQQPPHVALLPALAARVEKSVIRN